MKFNLGKLLASVLINTLLVFISAFVLKYGYNNILVPVYSIDSITFLQSFWTLVLGRFSILLFMLPYAENITKNSLGKEADNNLVEKSAFQFGVVSATFIFTWIMTWFI